MSLKVLFLGIQACSRHYFLKLFGFYGDNQAYIEAICLKSKEKRDCCWGNNILFKPKKDKSIAPSRKCFGMIRLPSYCQTRVFSTQTYLVPHQGKCNQAGLEAPCLFHLASRAEKGKIQRTQCRRKGPPPSTLSGLLKLSDSFPRRKLSGAASSTKGLWNFGSQDCLCRAQSLHVGRRPRTPC